MNAQNEGKLKKVLEAVPAGYLVDAAWLIENGIAYETFRDYVKRGWLERVQRGVYRRPGPDDAGLVDWKICLLSLQHIMSHDIHLGGPTALSLHGYEHYLRLGSNAPVWAYGDDVPGWLSRVPMNAQLQTRNLHLFADPVLGVCKDEGAAKKSLPWGWKLTVSEPERAVMEAMDELPDHESFHKLDMVFESLVTLRPRMLGKLLHSCKKIKVKRLFFVFADRHAHPWRKRLDPEDFNLGSGDRALVKGGRIHPQYRIMVPAEFANSGADDAA